MDHRYESRPRPASGRSSTRATAWSALDAVQLLTGLWLLVSPLVFPGPSELAAAKDVAVGMLLIALAVGAGLRPRVRAAQGAVLLLLGAVLVAGSVALEFGAGPAATARQWNEVLVGVLLVCLAGLRAR